MPRHYLEWKAIQYFKQKSYSYYELGENFKKKEIILQKKKYQLQNLRRNTGLLTIQKVHFN